MKIPIYPVVWDLTRDFTRKGEPSVSVFESEADKNMALRGHASCAPAFLRLAIKHSKATDNWFNAAGRRERRARDKWWNTMPRLAARLRKLS